MILWSFQSALSYRKVLYHEAVDNTYKTWINIISIWYDHTHFCYDWNDPLAFTALCVWKFINLKTVWHLLKKWNIFMLIYIDYTKDLWIILFNLSWYILILVCGFSYFKHGLIRITREDPNPMTIAIACNS